ncbi:MAG: hypothetical protein GX804_00275 [Lentisphaerae bacterium]|jgi:F-type H+-transporting ATPase subunit epsilon|nr:hypothetical protein [Lentisphaerota bacterium]
MAKKFSFSIITPEGIAYETEAEVIEIVSSAGSLGIMAGHEPIITDSPPGKVRILKDNVWTSHNCDDGVFIMDGEKARLLTTFAGAQQAEQ